MRRSRALDAGTAAPGRGLPEADGPSAGDARSDSEARGRRAARRPAAGAPSFREWIEPMERAALPCGVVGFGVSVAGWLAWAAGIERGLLWSLVGTLLLAASLGFLAVVWRRERSRTRSAEPSRPQQSAISEDAAGAAARSERLLRIISHDLRSPLGAVLNYATIVLEDNQGKLDEASLHNLERMRASAGRAMDLVEGLLALSRIGRRTLEKGTVDMEGLAREAAASCRPAGVGGADAVEVRVGPLPRIEGDTGLLRRMFEELLDNALRHSPTGSAPVEVSGRREEAEAVYQVRDHGEGLDASRAADLFAPFLALEEEGSPRRTGTGLAIVDIVVRRHGGRVEVDSRPGQGATFTVRLPAAGPPS